MRSKSEAKNPRKIRHRRIRKKVVGTAQRPRLCVFRSLKNIYAQVIDDERKHTLLGVSSLTPEVQTLLVKQAEQPKQAEPPKQDAPPNKGAKRKKDEPQADEQNVKAEKPKGKKTTLAQAVGQVIAQKALAQSITQVVFDRGGYKFHGRVAALANAARAAGLKF